MESALLLVLGLSGGRRHAQPRVDTSISLVVAESSVVVVSMSVLYVLVDGTAT